MRSYKYYACTLFLLPALILGLSGQRIAYAIPSSQRDCDTTGVSTTSNSFTIVPNTAVTVNNDVTRACVIQFSTEVYTSVNTSTRLRYTINSPSPANCIAIGPGDNYFSQATGAAAVTRTAIGVITLSSGTQIIRPCFNAVDYGEPGVEESTFGRRCLLVECRTQ